MLEQIKQNLIQIKKVIAQLKQSADAESYQKYLRQLKILNNAIPSSLIEIEPTAKQIIPEKTETYKKFPIKDNEAMSEFIPQSFLFAKISNKFFRGISEKLAPNFDGLSRDIKKANIQILLTTYISIILFSTCLSFLLSIGIFSFLFALGIISWTYLIAAIIIPIITFTIFYVYPASESSSIQKAVTYELPFATVNMAAIASSNVEPTKIFKIIASSKEYPNIGKEIKKIVIQATIYGYDLVSALKNVAKSTSSSKFAELLIGLATNITTGGELKTYLEKKAENFLVDYKLERQKYTELAGTFMDVYISILIAAPLILMLMFIVMNVAGLGLGSLTITSLLFITIGIIIVINILFLIILNLKQPKV